MISEVIKKVNNQVRKQKETKKENKNSKKYSLNYSLKSRYRAAICFDLMGNSSLSVGQFDVHLIEVIVFDQRRRIRVENVDAEKGHLQVTIDDPV